MRLPLPLRWLGLMTLFAAVSTSAAQTEVATPPDAEELLDDPRAGSFVYLRPGGAPILLQASPLYAAAVAPHRVGARGLHTPPDGLELDPRGDRPDLLESGVTLFRVPYSAAPRGLDTPPPPDAWQVALRSDLPAQPVFEHGAALRIPSNEVIVGFDPSTTREEAMRLLSEVWDGLRARELWDFRPGTFICELRDASTGRVFEISRRLTKVNGVRWAEPSFINVYLETPGGPPGGLSYTSLPTALTHQQKLESKYFNRLLSPLDREPEGNVWKLAVDGHFENDIDQWVVARGEGANRVLPVVVKEPVHDGNRAVHMSGKGLAANVPPDPYAESAGSYLIGPVFDLSGYDDVFIELWFWARFEDPVDAPRRVDDFGRVLLYDLVSHEYVYERSIAPARPEGDLTRGPGTASGWRKLMFRVPFRLRTGPLQLHVHFHSDGLGGSDGLFVDDIRVLYSAGDGGDPFSRDPAAQQQYAISPRGQIAGWPAPGDPRADGMAGWSAGIPEKHPIVALLDDGVETGHPDLVYWEPEKSRQGKSESDEDPGDEAPEEMELPPGEPVSPDDRHGTACAGLLGAIANNGIGIAGVVPGARLLPLHRGTDDVSIVRAIDAAVATGADVLVMPWGWSGAAPEVITRAILDAINAGTTVVAAAGDGVHRPYSDAVDYPCSLSESTALICAGASSIAGEPKSFASADGQYWWRSAEDASGPDLVAPGTWLHATDRRGPLGYNDGSQKVPSEYTDEFAGTGASACYVGGVAALMAAHDPLLQPMELKRWITATATELPSISGRRDELRLVAPGAAAWAAVESAAARDRVGEETEATPEE